MTDINHARFCYNNWLDLSTLTASSSLSGYPSTNLVHSIRSKLWKAEGVFEISATNNKVYINSTTYTVAVGSYTVATLITAFNTATSQTLSRNSLGRFIITLGGAGTLDLATTTNAIWGALGYLGSANLAGTAFTADESRYNTGEWIKTDTGMAQLPTFAALIPAANTLFSAPTATIKLQGNNLDLWDSPPVDVTMEVSDEGAFCAPGDVQACRFWRIFIDDVTNSAITAAVGFIGDGVITTNTNVATGFTRSRDDQSVRLYSESGALYIDRRPKVLSLSSVNMQLLKDTDLDEMEQLFYDLGIETPFFLCIDPQKGVSPTLAKMTHYVAVKNAFQLQHVIRGYYNLSVELREYL
jgi:hypothetical protein